MVVVVMLMMMVVGGGGDEGGGGGGWRFSFVPVILCIFKEMGVCYQTVRYAFSSCWGVVSRSDVQS